MKWIKSLGGPLICVDEIWADCWQGNTGSSESKSPGERASDYERACATKDYVVELATNGGRALILGDMPLETSVSSGRRTTIVRLFYADPYANFDDLLVNINDEFFRNPIETTRYQAPSGRIFVFDAALDGRERSHNFLAFSIDGGQYEILTAIVKPNSRTSLLLHRFFRLN